jgi:tetratricopeptide (TPR) repeat protein
MNLTFNLMLNLAVKALQDKRLEEAEERFKKLIELKPDYALAHYNLGNTLYALKKFDEAIINYQKTLELNPEFPSVLVNLANTLKKLNRFDESIEIYKKMIKLEPDNELLHSNLDKIMRQKKLMSNFLKSKKSGYSFNKNFISNAELRPHSSDFRLISNPFISNRAVEIELITELYKINTREFEKGNKIQRDDSRYGNGLCSDFLLFENDSIILKKVAKSLTKIIQEAVKSEIFIMDSFFNILKAGSGSRTHSHENEFDIDMDLVKQKYSLTYYLSVGDQNCSEPGHLNLYDPEQEVLVSEGKIVIIPATRKHSAKYGGITDRIMIGVNFYSLT